MKILFKPSLNFRSFWYIVVVFCVPVSRVTWSSAALRAQEASSQTGIKFPIGKNFMVFNTLFKPDLWIQLTGSESQCLNYFLHFKRFKWVNGKFLLFRVQTVNESFENSFRIDPVSVVDFDNSLITFSMILPKQLGSRDTHIHIQPTLILSDLRSCETLSETFNYTFNMLIWISAVFLHYKLHQITPITILV